MGLTLDLGHARKLSREDPLLRAVGSDARVVVDATAGLGRDAASLARLGISVIAIERAPALIALWRAALVEAPWNLAFLEGDARDQLTALRAWGLVPDAVVLDPMYAEPLTKRRAAPAKELVELRALVGDDADAASLLEVAREHVRRVVVKRPRHAPPLAPNPAHSWTGASTRFDLYLRAP